MATILRRVLTPSEDPMLGRQSSKRLRTPSLILLIAAAMAIAAGCASSAPPPTEGPPETPELSTPATAPDDHPSQSDSEEGGDGSASDGTGGGSGSGAEGANAGGSPDGPTEDPGGSDGSPGAGASSVPGEAPPAGTAATADESAALLDTELAASAGKFDAKMLEELRRLAAEASGRAGDDAAPASQSGSKASTGQGADAPDEGAEENSGGVGGSSSEAGGAQNVPPDVGDGSDDDIVARQLREAAMEEEDPELREKLWDEYRRYKASVSGASGGDS